MDNQPATAGSPATVASGTGWREWTVTSLVAAMYAGGVEHGFVIRDANEGQDAEQSFRSREDGASKLLAGADFRPGRLTARARLE